MYNIYDELKHVYCSTCGLESLTWWNGNKAAANWNALIRKRLSAKQAQKLTNKGFSRVLFRYEKEINYEITTLKELGLNDTSNTDNTAL